MTWLNPNTPMTRGTSSTPDSRLMLPKVNRGMPVAPSVPMVAIMMPSMVEISPLVGESPSSQLMLLRDRTITATISLGPNSNPISASPTPRKVRIRMPMVPPQKDAIFVVNRAFPG